MQFTNLRLIIILLIITLSYSCLKTEEYPIEPEIAFNSFTVYGDSAKLTIDFTDGDGDIGLSESDTISPYNPGQKYHHNLFLEYYEKDDALGWVAGKDLAGNNIVFKYRVPNLTPTGKNKALKGKIEVTIEPTYFNPFSTNADTLKYKITLVDRALHESAVVETDVIYR